MRGRIGMCVAVTAAALMLAGGCKSPQQKQQDQAAKQAQAQAKARQMQQEANARAERERIAAQQRIEQQRLADERARADAYARAEQKRMAEQRQIAEANARAEQEKAAAQARIERENAAKQASITQERAVAQAQLQSDNAAAAAKANQEYARADAAAQKHKNAKPAKSKPYPDDEQWVIGDPYIHPENYTTLFDKHAQAMAAAGAAADSSLYDQHFDGAELNALGRSKVALMLQAAPKNEPLTIYVPTTGSSERVQARLAAVNKFWRDSQWAALAVQTKQGNNPETAASAAAGLAGLRKLEKEEQQDSSRNPADHGASTGGTTMGPGGSSSGGTE